jgi:hypothetical protein
VTIRLVPGSPSVTEELMKMELPSVFTEVAVWMRTDELVCGTTRTLKEAPGMPDSSWLKMAHFYIEVP